MYQDKDKYHDDKNDTMDQTDDVTQLVCVNIKLSS